ncbi:MAG: nitrilase-related carbon-nitrogen hydrolase, partial [Terriglobales bacterium]
MKLALLQLEPRLLAREQNLASALRLMRSAPADVYVLPELFPSGYTFAAQQEVEQVAEPASDGPSLTALAAFARQHRASVAYGFAERAGGRFYNSANLVGPGGLLATYRKMHLFGREKLFFSPGEAAAPVVELAQGRVGLMICFDWYFPEVARSLALGGAELLLHPSNLVLPHCPQAMLTRSLENRVFSATCDRVGTERNGEVTHTFIGMSQVVNPMGEILVRLSREREETAVVEIDLAAARSKAVGQYNDLFADRQPQL